MFTAGLLWSKKPSSVIFWIKMPAPKLPQVMYRSPVDSSVTMQGSMALPVVPQLDWLDCTTMPWNTKPPSGRSEVAMAMQEFPLPLVEQE